MTLTHDDLLKKHDAAYNNNYDTRLKGADDMLFAWVTQWDDTYLKETDLAYRGEFNMLRKAMRQIISDLIANPVQVDFDPVDVVDEEVTEIINGMYRADMRNNTALEATKNCTQEAIVCGVGAWELRNEYKTNKKGDERQVIKRYPLYEANNNIMWDPNAKLLDKSDANYVSCLVAYSEDGYKKLKEELGCDDVGDSSFSMPEISYVFPWISQDKKIYVTRFYDKQEITVEYLTYQDMFGEEITIDKRELSSHEEELAKKNATLQSTKKVKRFEVTKYIASGDGILESVVVPGQHIPVIPQYGERQFVEGEESYEGIVRLAKDPQRLRNFQLSYLADIVSRSPREKPIFTQEQIGGYEDMYEQSGSENNYPYMKQNAFDPNGNPLPIGPVGYLKSPEVPPALLASIGETAKAVEDVAGAGLPSNFEDLDLSGKAINSLTKRLDMQSFIYQDNHKVAQRRDGEVYASMIGDIKDIEEDVTVVGFDGAKSIETINKSEVIFGESGVEQQVTNDLRGVEFDVYADIGPAFESVKSQNREEIQSLLKGMDPQSEMYNVMLNEYLTMIDGFAFKDIRDYARWNLIEMGEKEPETDEEKAKLQAMQQAKQQQEDPAMIMAKAEMLKGQADLLEQQNRQKEIELTSAKIQGEIQGKQEKLISEVALNHAKVDQEQQRIDNEAASNNTRNAIELTKVEIAAQKDLNEEMISNKV